MDTLKPLTTFQSGCHLALLFLLYWIFNYDPLNGFIISISETTLKSYLRLETGLVTNIRFVKGDDIVRTKWRRCKIGKMNWYGKKNETKNQQEDKSYQMWFLQQCRSLIIEICHHICQLGNLLQGCKSRYIFKLRWFFQSTMISFFLLWQ